MQYSNQTFSRNTSLSCPSSRNSSGSSLTYDCTVGLEDGECWQVYNISVGYRNAAEGHSPYSVVHRELRGPLGGELDTLENSVEPSIKSSQRKLKY